MSKYHVAYMCVYSDVVEADSPEEAADIVAQNCPYDIDGNPFITDIETGDQFELF